MGEGCSPSLNPNLRTTMVYLLRKLPLPVKLLLIGIIPMLFIVYLTFQLHQHKQSSLNDLNAFKDHLHHTTYLNQLTDALQLERKGSFDVVIKKWGGSQLTRQRISTNQALTLVKQQGQSSYAGIEEYTRLGQLDSIRRQIDRSKAGPNDITHYYSNIIFRLNTLSGSYVTTNPQMQDIHKELAAQKILSDMYTYLAIIRSNIYNVLHTRRYMKETLIGTQGAYDMFKSYEKELLFKAPPVVVEEYNALMEGSVYGPIIAHIDELFATYDFDESFTSSSWWDLSHKASEQLNGLRNQVWVKVQTRTNTVYESEQKEMWQSLVLLIAVLTLLILVIIYTIVEITHSLNDLKYTAERIAMGETGQHFESYPDDAIGSLARSIERIDEHYQRIAWAAAAIGKGKFSVNIKPRSNVDILGKALFDMKQELYQYSRNMENRVQQRTVELQRSNEDLQQFAHVASHDLKEPLRKIQMYADRLEHQFGAQLPKGALSQLQKINNSAQRMSQMIGTILQYAQYDGLQESSRPVDLNEILDSVKDDLELIIGQKKAVIETTALPIVQGVPVLIRQVFYNLLYNSLKFSHDERTPVISVAAITDPYELEGLSGASDQPYVVIRITDNGIGFDPKESEKIFQLFSRLHSKDQYEGTGLGLALCRKIVESQSGFITATGKKNGGAVFTLALPAASENLTASRKEARLPEEAEQGREETIA